MILAKPSTLCLSIERNKLIWREHILASASVANLGLNCPGYRLGDLYATVPYAALFTRQVILTL